MSPSKKGDELTKLIDRVLSDELSHDELIAKAIDLLDLKEGQNFPEIIIRSLHYIDDKDIREADRDYHESQREKLIILLS